jgi:hypothetical protein
MKIIKNLRMIIGSCIASNNSTWIRVNIAEKGIKILKIKIQKICIIEVRKQAHSRQV